MRNIFLGKPWHWALLCVISFLLWLAGNAKMHVISFNIFFVLLLVGSLLVVLLILRTTKPGERVTREEIDLPDDD